VDAAQCRVELPQTHRLDGNPFAVRDSEGNTLVFGLCPDGTEGPTTEALRARLQHVVFASTNAQRSAVFYSEVLGFTVSDRVLDDTGVLRACFLRTDSEHHSLAVFQATRSGLDHHCYESRDWGLIRDWADHLASLRIPLKWGPGRHGPGNNLFIFIEDPDGNWIEISAELESVAANRPPGTWRHEERTLNAWGAAYLRSE
jgi:catechol 2,3-dioxygenase-like lactoylglutathione lyase family enzyme